MTKLLFPVIAALTLSACGYKFNSEIYSCKGVEKTFYPKLHKLSYVAPDATSGYKDKKDVLFRVTVEDKKLPFFHGNFRVEGRYGVYFRSESQWRRSLHNNDGLLGGIITLADGDGYTLFSFDKVIGNFEETTASYRDGSNDGTKHAWEADVAVTVQAHCDLVK